MTLSYDKNAAIVVLPPISAGWLKHPSLRAWLAQSDLTRESETLEVLARVTRELGLPYPEAGLGALRMWGQTGDRPTKWIAGADPVYLEARLDHLCLHALRRNRVSAAEFRTLIDYLQATLADEQQYGFMRLGSYGYLSSKEPIATAAVSTRVVDQEKPDAFLPQGDASGAFRNLLSEIEMALHEHEVNLEREARGLWPVNSLWLWGGGTAAEQITRPQPPLFSEDALMTGYWYSATAVAEPWKGSIAACIDDSVAGFVAEIPEFESDQELLEQCLGELRDALRAGRLSRLILLFRDGLRADVRRSQALRIWRRSSSLLDEQPVE